MPPRKERSKGRTKVAVAGDDSEGGGTAAEGAGGGGAPTRAGRQQRRQSFTQSAAAMAASLFGRSDSGIDENALALDVDGNGGVRDTAVAFPPATAADQASSTPTDLPDDADATAAVATPTSPTRRITRALSGGIGSAVGSLVKVATGSSGAGGSGSGAAATALDAYQIPSIPKQALGRSAAFTAFMELVKPVNAARNVLLDRPEQQRNNRHKAYKFADHDPTLQRLTDGERRRMIDKAKRRILEQTELTQKRIQEREDEELRRRNQRDNYAGKRKTEWHSVVDQEYKVATSSGRADSIRLKVWTTQDLEKKRPGPRKLVPFGRRGFKTKGSRRGKTEFSEFSLRDGKIAGGDPDADFSQHEIFMATWKFLDEEEREFAAAFYLQCWWRRKLYADDPEMYARFRLETFSLLDALAASANAQPAVDDDGRTVFALPEKEPDPAAPLPTWYTTNRRNSQQVIDELFKDTDLTKRQQPQLETKEAEPSPRVAPMIQPEPEPAAAPEPEPEPEAEPEPEDITQLQDELITNLLADRCSGGIFNDEKSGFVFSADYKLGPPGVGQDDAVSGGEPETPAARSARHEKMKRDWILAMHSIWVWPTTWSRVHEMMTHAGWEGACALSESEWQEAVQLLFREGAINVAQRKDGSVFELWF